MARGIFKIITAALAVTAAANAAQAGGFSRGTADTDLIYEDGNFNIRAGVTIVSPTRKYTINGVPALVGTNYTDTYVIPSAAIKLNVNDDLRCAGTFSQPYGGSTTFDVATVSKKLSENFTINEIGLSCGYKFDLSKGRVWVLGGIFQEIFDYSRVNQTPFGNANLTLDGTDIGFRIGAAYEIPEIALRAQLMYRTGSEYGADGGIELPTAAVVGGQAQALAQQALAAAAVGNLVLAGQLQAQALALQAQIPGLVAAGASSTVPAIGAGKLPQSVELKLQSGIAPGWLAFGSVKWTDWSVTEQLIVTSPLGVQTNDYFWKDGWTVSLGVGHAFNDKVSGAASLTWDQGVKTGYDLSSDTWTLGVGGSYKDDMGGEFRGGVGLTYITGATETLNAAGENSAVKGGMAYAVSASYKVKW